MARMTLRAARINQDLSQAQAADLLDISKDTLSRYERGLSFPDVPTITKMEEIYKVSYDDLIFSPEITV